MHFVAHFRAIETRFYSLSKVFHTVNLFFDLINEYGEFEQYADSFWTTFKLHGKKIYENRVERLKMIIERAFSQPYKWWHRQAQNRKHNIPKNDATHAILFF